MKKDEQNDDPSHLIKTRAKVLTYVYLGVIGVICAWVWSHGSDLNAAIERPKLNSLGDFLAGVFAPIAFVWLAVTVLIQSNELRSQREELQLSREEYALTRAVVEEQAKTAKKQSALAEATARVNYKLSLFDKRIAVYTELEAVINVMTQKGSLYDDLDRIRLNHAVVQARNFFGTDIVDWLEIAQQKNREANKEKSRVSRIERQLENIVPTDAQTDQYEQALVDLAVKQDAVLEHLTWERLDELFLPHLKLPEDIATMDEP